MRSDGNVEGSAMKKGEVDPNFCKRGDLHSECTVGETFVASVSRGNLVPLLHNSSNYPFAHFTSCCLEVSCTLNISLSFFLHPLQPIVK